MSSLVRKPVVAGTFYPADVTGLRGAIDWCFSHPFGPGALSTLDPTERSPTSHRMVIVPHAGYRYSGPIAAHAYRRLAASGTRGLVVLIGPNHHLMGAPIAVSGCDFWQTPMGQVAVDRDASNFFCERVPFAAIDDVAHTLEHSLEVQIPFVQLIAGDDVRILPVLTCAQDIATSRALGTAIAEVVTAFDASVIATSDFSHYVSHQKAIRDDEHALRAIVALHPEELEQAILKYGLSMCGPGQVCAELVAAKLLGATRGNVLRYGTSGQMSGDYSKVVGYAAISIE